MNPLRLSKTTTFNANASIQCRNRDMPNATRITAQKNNVSPVGQKQERAIPSPQHTVHMQRHW